MKCTDAQIEEALKTNGWNRTKAAKALGVSLKTIRDRIRGKNYPKIDSARKESGSGHKGITVKMVIAAMLECKGNRTKAAESLEITIQTLYHHLEKTECIGERLNPYVSHLWTTYLADKNNKEAFNELMEYYVYWVTNTATQMAHRYPSSIDLNDLIQEGCLGVMESIPKYDPEKNPSFTSFAHLPVRGRILDFLRDLDSAPRIARTMSKKRKQLEQIANMTPELIMEKLGWTEEQYKESQIRETGSLEHILYSKEQREVRLHETLAYAIEHPVESQFRLAEFTKAMNVEEAIVIYGYYWKEKTMKEIGQFLNLSESRVSQLHSQIIEKIRAKGHESALETLSSEKICA